MAGSGRMLKFFRTIQFWLVKSCMLQKNRHLPCAAASIFGWMDFGKETAKNWRYSCAMGKKYCHGQLPFTGNTSQAKIWQMTFLHGGFLISCSSICLGRSRYSILKRWRNLWIRLTLKRPGLSVNCMPDLTHGCKRNSGLVAGSTGLNIGKSVKRQRHTRSASFQAWPTACLMRNGGNNRAFWKRPVNLPPRRICGPSSPCTLYAGCAPRIS